MSEHFTYQVKVNPDWIDHNGHLNVAYFVLAFDYTTDAYYETTTVGAEALLYQQEKYLLVSAVV